MERDGKGWGGSWNGLKTRGLRDGWGRGCDDKEGKGFGKGVEKGEKKRARSGRVESGEVSAGDARDAGGWTARGAEVRIRRAFPVLQILSWLLLD